MTKLTLAVLALGLLLGACGSLPRADTAEQHGWREAAKAAREERLRSGTVAGIKPVRVDGEHQLGLASEVGTSAGGLIGNQLGGGTQRDLVTVLTAIGGGPAADEQQERYERARQGQRIVVRLDNGVGIAVTQEVEPDLEVGDRVRVEGRGLEARVVKRD